MLHYSYDWFFFFLPFLSNFNLIKILFQDYFSDGYQYQKSDKTLDLYLDCAVAIDS